MTLIPTTRMRRKRIVWGGDAGGALAELLLRAASITRDEAAGFDAKLVRRAESGELATPAGNDAPTSRAGVERLPDMDARDVDDLLVPDIGHDTVDT